MQLQPEHARRHRAAKATPSQRRELLIAGKHSGAGGGAAARHCKVHINFRHVTTFWEGRLHHNACYATTDGRVCGGQMTPLSVSL